VYPISDSGFKKGPYSKVEDLQLNNAIEQYRTQHNLSQRDLERLIFNSRQMKGHSGFWTTITSTLPHRDFKSVNARVRRIYNPLGRQGQWTEHEDNKLLAAVNSLGASWEKAGRLVGRTGQDCKDRYRNHLACEEAHAFGKWSEEEEVHLTRVVTELTDESRDHVRQTDFWMDVQKKMGNMRTRQQCRDKWVHSLSKTVKNEGKALHWSRADTCTLVHKVRSLPRLEDQTELVWSKVVTWKVWNSRDLRRRWNDLKRTIEDHENKTHQEIVDVLSTRYPHQVQEAAANQ